MEITHVVLRSWDQSPGVTLGCFQAEPLRVLITIVPEPEGLSREEGKRLLLPKSVSWSLGY